jgi:hypothetical protein
MPHDQLPDLFDLIGLGFVTPGLQIEDFFDARLAENVMIAADTLFKPKTFEQRTQSIERHRCVGSTHQDVLVKSFVLVHARVF